MASVIRGSDNFDSLVHQGIGVNQTWQDLFSSRVVNVVYTNTTGKPIMVTITTDGSATNGSYHGLTVYVYNEVGAIVATISSMTSTTWTGDQHSVTFIVPNGYKYTLAPMQTILRNWSELR